MFNDEMKLPFMSESSLTVVPDALLSQARELLPSLPGAEQRLLSTVLAAPDEVPSKSITELARAASCSEATVVRLCQRLGLRGYGELRLLLARRGATSIDLALGPIRADESDRDLLVKTLGQASQLLESIAVNVSSETEASFSRAIDVLDAADETLVLGIGASSAIAQDAAHQLRTIGLTAHAPVDPFAQIFEAGRLRPGSACLIVSHTGATVDMIRCAEAARRAGASSVAISSYRTTPLQAEVDVLLVAGAVVSTFRPEAATNRIAHLLLVDALVSALTLRHPERSAAALEYLQAVTTTNQI